MGLFKKLEENIHHGGVKVELQAPAEASMQNPVLDVAVTVTASDEVAQIKNVSAKLMIERTNNNLGIMGVAGGVNNPGTTLQTIAQAQDNTPFTLNPGQSKTLQFSIALSSDGQVANVLGEAAGFATGSFSFSNNHLIMASANVEGIALDPSVHQKIKISGGPGILSAL